MGGEGPQGREGPERQEGKEAARNVIAGIVLTIAPLQPILPSV